MVLNGFIGKVKISADGTFTGVYSDSEASMVGENYDSTVYISNFSGTFSDIKKIGDETYSLTLTQIGYKDEIDKEWIENNIKYIDYFTRT